MRKIITKDGAFFLERSKKFIDNGDHILCRNGKNIERIYKINIASDCEKPSEDPAILSITIAVIALSIFLISTSPA